MEIPRHWRLKQQRYALIGEQCGCGAKMFPPRDVCVECGTNLGPFNEDPYLKELGKRKEAERQEALVAIRNQLAK